MNVQPNRMSDLKPPSINLDHVKMQRSLSVVSLDSNVGTASAFSTAIQKNQLANADEREYLIKTRKKKHHSMQKWSRKYDRPLIPPSNWRSEEHHQEGYRKPSTVAKTAQGRTR